MRDAITIAASFAGFLALGIAVAAWFGSEAFLEEGRELVSYRSFVGRLDVDPKDAPRLVWLGDSAMMEATGYPRRIEDAYGARVDAIGLYYPAMDPYHHYFLSGPVLEREPDLVVLGLHLRMFGPHARARRFDLASFLHRRELPRAVALPLHERGYSIPGLLSYQLLRVPAIERLYLQAIGARQRFHDASFWSWLGEPLRPTSRVALGVRTGELYRYDEPLHGRHPTVAVVGATADAIRREGSRLLAVVTPIPTALLASHGRYDAERYRRRIAVLREEIERAGGTFVDLHDLLPPDAFADHLGHMTPAGSQRVAEVLLPEIHRMLAEEAGLEGPPPELVEVSSRRGKRGGRRARDRH